MSEYRREREAAPALSNEIDIRFILRKTCSQARDLRANVEIQTDKLIGRCEAALRRLDEIEAAAKKGGAL
jgi:hypothetical protein